MDARKFDVCECGDYRHQHAGVQGHGDCAICMFDCRQFRAHQRMVPTWVYVR